MTTIARLNSIYSTLPPAERRVASFVLNDPELTTHMTINSLASSVSVSLPSVTRLTKKLGYSGFAEFKVALARSLSEKGERSDAIQTLQDDDTDRKFVEKLLCGQSAAINATVSTLDVDKLCVLASRLAGARRVVFFGYGSSIDVVRSINDDFVRIGLDSALVNDPGYMCRYARLLSHDDVFIGVSRSGITKRTLDCLDIAIEQGAYTAFFTNLITSPAADKADLFFVTPRLEEISRYCGLETNGAEYIIMEVLSIIVARMLGRFSKGDYVRLLVEDD